MTSYLKVFCLVVIATRCFSNTQGQQQGSIHQSSSNVICDEGYACVPWQSCVGSSVQERPADYDSLRCGEDGNMCCAVSDNLLSSLFESIGGITENLQQNPSDIATNCGHASYDCVPYFQCTDGVIVSDGAGLIDIRIRPTSNCVNSEYPNVPAVCCLIPDAEPTPTPVETCPDYQECVDYSLCSSDGRVITDGSGLIDIRTGYTSCYLPSGIGGRCCTPPAPYLDTCPGESTCILGDSCTGQALDAANKFIDYVSNGFWTHCAHGSSDGVCCILPPPIILDSCPGESVCLQPHECKGTALNDLEDFVDYNSQGSWTHCAAYNQGVCCINAHKAELNAAAQCGIRNYNVGQRITSHNEASFGEFPWQTIIFYQNYTFNCGASIISNEHILTAAHCVKGLEPSQIRVRFGEWQVNSFDEQLPYVDLNVHAIYVHSDFNPKNVHNDVAILELAEPLTFQYHINAICLPSHGQTFESYTSCIATGWGKDSFTGTFQHILKKIELPFVDRHECQKLLRRTRLGRYFRLHDSFVCAGGEENKDACYGDGGGPLICKDETTSQYVLTGITSWGIGCGQKNVPGVYVDVQKFTGWINGIIGGSKGNKHQKYADTKV